MAVQSSCGLNRRRVPDTWARRSRNMRMGRTRRAHDMEFLEPAPSARRIGSMIQTPTKSAKTVDRRSYAMDNE